MARNINTQTFTNPASLVLVGEISHTLRAAGNALATGVKIENSSQSPVVSGKYKEIPQPQVGILDYSSFAASASKYRDNGSVGTGVGDRTPWNVMGAVSLDALFCPYNNLADSGRVGPYMPYWTNPSGSSKIVTSKTLNPFDPFNQLETLNPFNDVWTSGGHNVAMALSYNPLDSGNSGDGYIGGYVGYPSGEYPGGTGAPVDIYFEKDFWARRTVERSGIRSVGLKSPLVLTGWGYDTNNLPVPASTGNASRFHEEASWNTHLWKSGPVDLRWDEERGVWTNFRNRVYLVKLTNVYTPPSFSFEVDRSNSRDQYTRNAPKVAQDYNPSGDIYDPEYVAYNANTEANQKYYEQLNYEDLEYPFYEAFIIRENDDSSVCANNFYHIWSEDCQDCGHITNQCGDGHGTEPKQKRILIENPLRQSFDVGDLAFTVYTGRQQRVNTGQYIGGDGQGALGRIVTNVSGDASFQVINAGSNYLTGGFGVFPTGCKVCTNLTLKFEGGSLIAGIMEPSGGFPANQYCDITIYPNNAHIETKLFPIHWVIQSEFKSQQVVTHVECDNGILQTCTMKLQTQGYKTCEWCGEDTAFINN